MNIGAEHRKEVVLIGSIVLVLLAASSLVLSESYRKNTPSNISPPVPTILPTMKRGDEKIAQNIRVREQQASLEKYLTVEAALLGVADNMSLYFKALNPDWEISIEPTRSWIPASTIKAFVVLEAFRQRRLGLLAFDQIVTITADNVVPTELETDEYPRLREGTHATIEQLIGAMITQSDNTAYNTLLDILDRRNINATLKNLGITQTVVGEKLNLDDAQFQKDLAIPGRQPNTITAKDFVSLFTLLYSGKVPDSQEILAIFKKQKINTMIPALLPKEIAVAHKTGDLAPIFHDGGLIYKPADPFILVVFTNSNDPAVLAKLARVAYFQNVNTVGEGIESENTKKVGRSGRFYLAATKPDTENVLAAATSAEAIYRVEKGDTLWDIAEKFYHNGFRYGEIVKRNNVENPSSIEPGATLIIPSVPASLNEKFPRVTAADLGITTKDLTEEKQEVEKVRTALITPGSILYGPKRFIESLTLQRARTKSQKVAVYLTLAKNRLSEMKTLLDRRNVGGIDSLLNEAESNLKQAAEIVKSDTTLSNDLLQIKQLQDLHFATLAQEASYVEPAKKEQFVDSVYRFYQKSRSDIRPVVENTLNINPFEQQPIIGTIDSIKGNTASVRFEDGSIQEVILTKATRIRTYHHETLDDITSLTSGSKVAIVAQTNDKGQKTPLFILKDIPKELPDRREGIVVEVNTQKNTLEIQNSEGKQEEIKADEHTFIKGRDTGVSLEGIKAGSKVTVFGEPEESSTQGPNATSAPGNETQENAAAGNTSTGIKATTITVTNNSSGSQEHTDVVNPPKTSEESKKEETKKDQSKTGETKKSEEKKK